MSMQYRPGHGGISHDTAACSETSNTILQPYLYTAGINKTSDLYVDLDQQSVYGASNHTIPNSPISPLSPQQSSLCSETHTRSLQSLDYRLYDNSNQCCTSPYKEHCFQGQSSVSDPTIVQAPFQSSSYFGSLSSSDDHHAFRLTKVFVPDKSQSCLGDTNVQHMLQELETALMGPDDDCTDLPSCACGGHGASPDGDRNETGRSPCTKQVQVRSGRFSCPSKEQQMEASIPESVGHNPSDRHRQIAPEQCSYSSNAPPLQTILGLHCANRRTQAEQLLVACAAAISDANWEEADFLMTKLKQSVSIYGDPIQRLAAYIAEGLVARLAHSGQGIYKALKCKEAPAPDLMSAMQKMYEICPYFKFGYMAANGAIAEAFKDEDKVHILDFQIAHGTQWISLIQALAKRPGGPPQVRITGVDDPESEIGPAGGLQTVGQRLVKIAEAVGVPFEFHPVPVDPSEIQASMIDLRSGEALAANFALQLHHMPDESVCITNPRDRLLRMVKRMNPKVLTLVEQEANTNTAPFFPRFLETLDYYSAVFESIDVVLPRDSKDRVSVEQLCLARDIVNIIACEGSERVERHELMGKWRARMMMAGFRPHPLSSYVNSTIKVLLESYSKKYRLQEEGGALFLGWLNRPLIVASAWC